ncbi:MAG: cysteine desulfurase [Ignavibacteria bacterium]|nr:cysteine desulfurase [Ignavibacteria bacterium]
MTNIFADYASTTPLDKRVLSRMMPYLTDVFYNASSTHAGGLQAQQAIMKARMDVARHVGAKMSEIIFTSGATEAINLAMLGIARRLHGSTRRKVVTAKSEHTAVLDCAEQCGRMGMDVIYLDVDSNGLVDVQQARSVVDDSTAVFSIMLVNNETGVIQDLKTLSEIAHSVGALFMTDATQGYGKLPIDVDDIGIDLMAFSAHKIYGPKGAGALFRRMRSDVKIDLEPILFGGGQEGGGIRSGTFNVPGIVGLAEAGNIAHDEIEQESIRVASLRNRFEQALVQLGGVSINGADAPRSYNISNVTFADMDNEKLLFELPHILCSKGSACTSTKTHPSHVLSAMGRSVEEASRTLRFSFGRFTTDEEINTLVQDLSAVLVTA